MMDANNRKTIKQMNQHGNNTQAEKHSTLFTMQIKPLKWNITFYWCESKDNHHSTSKQIAKPLSQPLVNSIHLWISLIHLINFLLLLPVQSWKQTSFIIFKAVEMHPLGLLIIYNENITAMRIYLQSTESTEQNKMMAVL